MQASRLEYQKLGNTGTWESYAEVQNQVKITGEFPQIRLIGKDIV